MSSASREATPMTLAIAGLVLISVSGDALADASGRGRLLYENHCQACHTSQMHVRERRKARTEDDVKRWVTRWQAVQGLDWTSSEIDDVAAYLFARYYSQETQPRS